MSSTTQKKIVAVVGATGAQGIAVIDALLAPVPDGTPSPYSVRGLTRNARGKRAEELKAKGVEWVEGSADDMKAISALLDGAYGAFINTDGFTLGEERELWAGMKIFEVANRTKSLRHYVWSTLDFVLKDTNFDEQYSAKHYDGKGRVAEYIKTFNSTPTADGLSWSMLSTGPYMDMLNGIFGPITARKDGTLVFASPIGNGHAPMIALRDLEFWARYIFDHRDETSAQELKVASEMVGWNDLVKTFSEVTGKLAVFVPQTVDEWFNNFFPENINRPISIMHLGSDPSQDIPGKTTIRENFSGWWSLFRDDIIVRDMEWIRRVHPGTQTVADWMKETAYDGWMPEKRKRLLKNVEDGDFHWTKPRPDVVSRL